MDMTGQHDIRTTFIFSPPVDNAQAWHLRLNDLAEAIQRDFPGASTKLQHNMGPRSSDAVSFEVEIQEQLWLEGLATTPFEGVGTVMVLGATASEAAVFAALVARCLHPGTGLDPVQQRTHLGRR
ncbi:hypothetical protein ABZ746_29280 [Streptomyces sp. NPDC020096]